MNFFLALGSNLGDRLANLRAAASAIRQLPGIDLTAAAPLYETDPVDCPPGSQPFHNTVIQVQSLLSPLELLPRLQEIEVELGRPNQHALNAPRTVDIDLLSAGPLILNHPALTLPHPRLHLRRFVLQPLADIAPQLIIPTLQQNVIALLQELQSPEPPLRLVAMHWLTPAADDLSHPPLRQK